MNWFKGGQIGSRSGKMSKKLCTVLAFLIVLYVSFGKLILSSRVLNSTVFLLSFRKETAVENLYIIQGNVIHTIFNINLGKVVQGFVIDISL